MSKTDASRRQFLRLVAAGGAGAAVFGRALFSLAQGKPEITEEMIQQAEWISGLTLTPEDRELMRESLAHTFEDIETIRRFSLDNGVPPALHFLPGGTQIENARRGEGFVAPSAAPSAPRPSAEEDVAFAPLTHLSAWIRSRQISSVELTRLYLDRLRRYDPVLACVITYTEKLALEQAERADREIARGLYRGPLHGVPWGAKDLVAVPGYPTTWGARPYQEQTREEKATVVARLEEAGAVLVAKLTLGALAMGDVWFGGTTKNPWKSDQGSSGSSAGSASATAAALVGFAIGSETRGSIVSPSTRCGITGLRPTFGRVSRHGAMALCWSMDKLGPMARSVEDCALVLAAIHGADGLDPTAVDRPFSWPFRRDVRTLRVGYVADLFERDRTEDAENEEQKRSLAEWQEHDRRSLEVLNEIGIDLIPLRFPDSLPVDAISFILTSEAAAAFDELTRSGRDDLLVRQVERAWPNIFRVGQMIPAVEYIRANRIRTLLVQETEEALSGVDVYVTPTFLGDTLLRTNLTGHPAACLPNGFRASDGTPTSITFIGRLYGETELLAVAQAYQQATDFHLKRPSLAALVSPSG